MKRAMFFVGDRPFSVWDRDIRGKNIRFLKSFAVGYFEYLANIHWGQVERAASQHAAIALRTTYGLALETLFSLMGAALQAPECVFGWLFKYKEKDLVSLVDTINGDRLLRTKYSGFLSWKTLSLCIHSNLVLADKDKEHEIKAGYAKCWEYLAGNFRDTGLRNEFNGTKHGLRIQPGGIRIAVGRQEHPGVPASPESMTSLGGSNYGSSVFNLEQIGSLHHDFRVLEVSKNWDLSCIVGRINVISMSIENVISFLLIHNGEDPSLTRFVWPEDLELFKKIWEPNVGLLGGTLGFDIKENDIVPTRAADVELTYPNES